MEDTTPEQAEFLEPYVKLFKELDEAIHNGASIGLLSVINDKMQKRMAVLVLVTVNPLAEQPGQSSAFIRPIAKLFSEAEIAELLPPTGMELRPVG